MSSATSSSLFVMYKLRFTYDASYEEDAVSVILRIALPNYSTFLGLMSICFTHNCVHASREKLEAFLLRSMEVGLISDGVLAQDINQAFSFWRIREVLLLNIFVGIRIHFLINIRMFLS